MIQMLPSNKTESLNIGILGGGSWGTALASVVNRIHQTHLWVRNPNQAEAIRSSRVNKNYLPGVNLPNSIHIDNNLDSVLSKILLHDVSNSLIILGVPVCGFSTLFEALIKNIPSSYLSEIPIIWTCKGFDKKTAFLPSEIIEKIFRKTELKTGVLSGPSFAKEVASGLPVALTIASNYTEVYKRISFALHGNTVRIYTSKDILGVELGGALKNVIAIACGISDGLNLGLNARAALITRGLAEISRLGIALGANQKTFLGLTGLGDLVLTATGELSRNRKLGIAISQGKDISEILSEDLTIEGIHSVKLALRRAKSINIKLPIMEIVYSVLFENLEPRIAVSSLLKRLDGLPES